MSDEDNLKNHTDKWTCTISYLDSSYDHTGQGTANRIVIRKLNQCTKFAALDFGWILGVSTTKYHHTSMDNQYKTCVYIYIYTHTQRKLFGTKRNWRCVPTSFSSPGTFFGVWPRSPTLRMLLIAKCFNCDAYLVLGMFLLPRFTS